VDAAAGDKAQGVIAYMEPVAVVDAVGGVGRPGGGAKL